MSDLSKYFPMKDYYRKVVIPLDPKRYRFSSGGKMICCLHDDHDPSLGIIKSKKGEIYHCFGCGKWGDIVDLHIYVVKRFKRSYLSREEALKDLCHIFNVDYSLVEEKEAEKGKTKKKREDLIKENMNKFDIYDFKYKLLDGKLSKRRLGYFNALMLSMLWEVKESSEGKES